MILNSRDKITAKVIEFSDSFNEEELLTVR